MKSQWKSVDENYPEFNLKQSGVAEEKIIGI